MDIHHWHDAIFFNVMTRWHHDRSDFGRPIDAISITSLTLAPAMTDDNEIHGRLYNANIYFLTLSIWHWPFDLCRDWICWQALDNSLASSMRLWRIRRAYYSRKYTQIAFLDAKHFLLYLEKVQSAMETNRNCANRLKKYFISLVLIIPVTEPLSILNSFESLAKLNSPNLYRSSLSSFMSENIMSLLI